MKYQKSADQLYNTTTTFGSAWFWTPNLFFQILHLEPNPVNIRLFSLLWLLFTIITIILLTKTLIKHYNLNKNIIPIVIVLYLFAPATMWYHIQGYVHEIAVLPFYFLGWYSLIQYINSKDFKWLLLLGICIGVGVQFDWLPCIQAGVITLYLFFNRNKLNSTLGFVVPAISILIGITYIIYHYSNWIGLQSYLSFMHSKFTARTIGAGGLKLISFLNHNFNIIIFYGMGMGAILLTSLISLIKKKKPNTFVLLIAATGILHHVVFWGFSTEHDHAAVKMLFPVIFISATFIADLDLKKMITVLSVLVLINIVQYFLLHNYPLRKGIYANENYCYEVGNIIKQVSNDKDEIVFLNTNNKYYSQIEFHAEKFYIHVNNLEAAKARLKQIKLGNKGCFIELEGTKIVNVFRFNFLENQEH